MKKSRLFLVTFLVCVYAFTLTVSVAALIRSVPVSGVQSAMRVVIDAGHGGIDGGVTGKQTKTKESDLNLKIALLLGQRLEENGFDVVYTRKTASGLYDTTAKGFKKRDMLKRKEIIENANPSLVISLHQNYIGAAYCRGATVFYRKESEGGKRFAEEMQSRLNGLYQKSGVKPRKSVAGEFFLLDCADCPSILVECGFLSNVKDESLLLSPIFQSELVGVMSASITAYLAQSGSA
ncbi:MAG: N-acetylmuramoyl-L-alanine amidase [Clostridia bacterium]|nr:N-acetylmuramoyl-L-alanine amidase [Clostridia bacterium]